MRDRNAVTTESTAIDEVETVISATVAAQFEDAPLFV